MPSAAENVLLQRIERLERMRSAGVLSQTVDGTTSTFRTTAELHAEIRRLHREVLILRGETPPHPFASELF